MIRTLLIGESDDIEEILISTVPFSEIPVKSYWGWLSTDAMLTEAQILALQGNGNFLPGGDIKADFRGGNAVPKFLFMAESADVPTKTKWFGTGLDQDSVGPGEVFSVIGVVAGWRVYRSSFATQFFTTTIFQI